MQKEPVLGNTIWTNDVWEDGTAVVRSEDLRQTQPKGKESGTGRMVKLDTDALQKSAEALKKHWSH
jgi:hypothetical protein